jgi:hypothetical protein
MASESILHREREWTHGHAWVAPTEGYLHVADDIDADECAGHKPKRDRRKAVGVKSWTIITYEQPKSELEEAFNDLVKEWVQDTRFHSSLSKKFMHPAYQTIMAMGEKALPLILKELQRAPGHWFYALKHIVRRDVAELAQGFEEARTMWLEWGERNHFIQ